MEKRKLTPMEEHFLEGYGWFRTRMRCKIHKWLFPNCRICKANEKLFKKLEGLTQTKPKGKEE